MSQSASGVFFALTGEQLTRTCALVSAKGTRGRASW